MTGIIRRFAAFAPAALALMGSACSSGPVATPAAPPDGGDAAPSCTPAAETSETVSVESEFGRLEGTLLVPASCAPMPVVLILSGSGTTDRDGNAPGPNKPSLYRILAETVHDAGFAVLRYDDPGIGGSANGGPSKNEDFRFEMEVDDAVLFANALRNDPRFGPIVVAGHSQGSLTGILTAQKQPIDGFVSLAGAGRPIGRLLHDQLAPSLSHAQTAELDAAIAKLEKGELAGPLPAPLDRFLPLDVQPYFISWMKYDPKTEIAKVRAPTLILQGRFDTQVTVNDGNLLAEGRPDASLVFVDDMGHMIRAVSSADPAAQRDSYTKPLPLHPAAATALTEFVAGVNAGVNKR